MQKKKRNKLRLMLLVRCPGAAGPACVCCRWIRGGEGSEKPKLPVAKPLAFPGVAASPGNRSTSDDANQSEAVQKTNASSINRGFKKQSGIPRLVAKKQRNLASTQTERNENKKESRGEARLHGCLSSHRVLVVLPAILSPLSHSVDSGPSEQ